MKKLAVLSALLLLIGIAASVHLWMQVKELNPSYQKVTVTVSEVQVIPPSFGKRYTEYIVKARVNGTEKQIHNIRKGFSYYVGKQLEVLEAGGELYEDESGVKTNTKAAQYYFISLGANLFLLALFLSSFLSYRKKEKARNPTIRRLGCFLLSPLLPCQNLAQSRVHIIQIGLCREVR